MNRTPRATDHCAWRKGPSARSFPEDTVVLLLASNPSDIYHIRTLFLDLRKEWQGFKNKVLEIGGSTFKQLSPDQEIQSVGLLTLDLKRLVLAAFHVKMPKTETTPFLFTCFFFFYKQR